ncbi:DUF2777 family protein [Bacillaceae bacterium IKA-2]|nr:DUF2777 family protein [Bacillaceae bacterium IKA-2]
MNRKEANNFIGKQIRVVDPLLGNYLGELVDIIAEPRKPWRGNVKIKEIELDLAQKKLNQKQNFTPPSFVKGKTYEIAGSKIEPVTAEKELRSDFEEPVIAALLKKIDHFQTENEKTSHELTKLKAELKKIDPTYQFDDTIDSDFQYYTVSNEKDFYYLIDGYNNQIPLRDCPFDFQINIKGQWIIVQYDAELNFIDKHQQRYQVKKQTKIRLNKDQFDPYQLFINELEKPALDSLNSGLKKYQMSHNNYVNCHNALLNQYLDSEEAKHFKGVNFISYQKAGVTLLIQHHYERDISDNGEDVTYDRFEYTSNKGKRLLMTYTTETTK